MSETFSLEGKVALVTGGAAGVGAAVVRLLLAENARHVAFLDLMEREGLALEAQLNNNFGAMRAKFIKCDIGDQGQLADGYAQVMKKYHRLDIVVNNAAIVSVDEALFWRMVDVNFQATVNSTYRALDLMRDTGGTVVNISSLLAFQLSSHLPVYAATKAAVLQFSNCLAADPKLSEANIKIVTICLGPTDTVILQRNSKDRDTINSRAPVRQRVSSAAEGIIEALKKGQNGSTWRVADDDPPVDITGNLRKTSELLTLRE